MSPEAKSLSESLVTEALFDLRVLFRAIHRDLRFVGGCVRDGLLGFDPDDIDLHTDATPEEQKAVYELAGVSCYETGIAHGTITIVCGDKTYEVTTLRRDVSTDGRHAEVEFTTDWREDLGRRDLTINAMSMSFEGALNDPFGGADDLAAGRVRFVGDPAVRIQEDYLRILRFFRFHARYAGEDSFDKAALEAIRAHGAGLNSISAERIWSELAKIISGTHGPSMIRSMVMLGLPLRLCGAPVQHRLDAAYMNTRNPVTLMTALLGERVVETGQHLRWSNDELRLARFLTTTAHSVNEGFYKRLLAVDRKPLDWVVELSRLHDCAAIGFGLRDWPVPVCPLTGDDLLALGMAAGPEVGDMLRRARMRWAGSDYLMTKHGLIEDLKRVYIL